MSCGLLYGVRDFADLISLGIKRKVGRVCDSCLSKQPSMSQYTKQTCNATRNMKDVQRHKPEEKQSYIRPKRQKKEASQNCKKKKKEKENYWTVEKRALDRETVRPGSVRALGGGSAVFGVESWRFVRRTISEFPEDR